MVHLPADDHVRALTRRSAAAGVLAAGLLLGGCAGTAAEATPSPTDAPLPDGVSVELLQLRTDVALRTAQVRVTNDSDTAFTVTRLVLADDWFDGDVVRERESEIGPNRAVDLRVDLPVSACGPDVPDAAARTSRVTLEYRTADGSYSSTADIPDPLGFMPALHARECLAARVAEAAALEWTSFEPGPEGAPSTLTLRATPEGGSGVTLAGVQTTNLLTFVGADPVGEFRLDLVLGDLSAPVDVTVPVVPFRCDAHAVQEDKRGTVFTLDVVVDAVPGEIELPVSQEMRGRMLTWVADTCGFGAG